MDILRKYLVEKSHGIFLWLLPFCAIFFTERWGVYALNLRSRYSGYKHGKTAGLRSEVLRKMVDLPPPRIPLCELKAVPGEVLCFHPPPGWDAQGRWVLFSHRRRKGKALRLIQKWQGCSSELCPLAEDGCCVLKQIPCKYFTFLGQAKNAGTALCISVI